jgi:7-cyano-7-deazaguanine reductase
MPDLKRLPNPYPDTNFLAHFTQPEFTSLCPVSAQPDFAQLAIDYAPNQFIVESKSLKLCFNNFHNHQSFYEACTVGIGKQIVELLAPCWLCIGGYWHPRGGILNDVFWQYDKVPAGTWIPDQGITEYRGRS